MPPDDDDTNPYERWDIDPLGGPAAITERMRELVEDAPDEAARKAIRAAWEELTLHPARRLRAALAAHPDSHGPPGARPPRPSRSAPPDGGTSLSALLPRPSVLDALRAADEATLPDLPFERDPILND
jgi:hypothetical protein